ncbi:MAG TPA: AAA family ATPase [Burkholderiaceae bacterium]|nr:AAA family ATPase [Burkholderiaceae bacterium]
MSSNDAALARHARLVQALLAGDAIAAPPSERELIETHISSLILAGDIVYKLHKPLKLDFLDFSTPELRRADCLEELRLNRRTAPQLYLDVLPLVGTADAPRIGAAGDAARAFDWVLRMRRFEQSALLDAMAREGRLTEAHIDALAERIAAFHAALAPAPPQYGAPEAARGWALANLDALDAAATSPAQTARIVALRRWTDRECARLAPSMRERQAQGFVRECHGDLHLGNIALIDGMPTPFDAITFNAELRHIDVASDVAFTFMDLLRHARPALAWRFASAWAERSGDYAGLALLRFYAVYRALVRARVAVLRAGQRGDAGFAAAGRDLALAESIAASAAHPPRLVLACGVSGSGKSTVARLLAQHAQAVRVRSDVERKRLFALAPEARPAPEALAGLYGPEATQRTYARLGALARGLLAAGISTVVDAAALRRNERDALRALAASADARFVLLECSAPEPVLRARITRRLREEKDASDADLAVLDLQLRVREPVAPDEGALAFDTDTSLAELARRCAALAGQWHTATTNAAA